MFDDLDEPALLDTMQRAQRAERVAVAERILAAGRLAQRRISESGTDNREQWCIDNWEVLAAEVGAELGISRNRASSQMQTGLDLIERLPQLAVVFAAGEVEVHIVRAALHRTGLIIDDGALASIDHRIATNAHTWNALSRAKITEIIDWFVRDLDPDGIRNERHADDDRHVEVGPARDGVSQLWGSVRAPDAALFSRRLDQLAATVCSDDPRTRRQRRADALAAVAAGASTMACGCGSSDCPATQTSTADTGQIVIHLLAEAETVSGKGNAAGFVSGFGAVPADTVRAWAARARLRPVTSGKELKAEASYRPSRALAEFVRCRDLTCRFPGCDRPAEVADIDHTVPYPFGPTHPSNLKLLCRPHHLLKTFYGGPGGWADQQLPDGTVIWTSPTGRTYTTKPHGALFFPQLSLPTEELTAPTTPTPLIPGRGLMMPTRRRTRAQDRAARIRWERNLNEARAAADPPPF
ncbi:HNH endonuclease [Mycobacterium sp. NBC_00419]|uniref:HNH endonuclease signature motif containing protein n=1 Tax=Mycobacterium sp. NBC_00419 TaxID=2975989 RepID=UPI002E2449A1